MNSTEIKAEVEKISDHVTKMETKEVLVEYMHLVRDKLEKKI